MHASRPLLLDLVDARRLRTLAGVVVCGSLLLLSGCQPISPDLEAGAAPAGEPATTESVEGTAAAPAETAAASAFAGLPEITVELTADGITVPEGVTTGPTVVHVVNNGGSMNEDGSPAMPELGRLVEGATQEQLMAAMPGAEENPGPALELIRIYGGSFMPQNEVAWELQAGEHLAFTTADPLYMESFMVEEGEAAEAPQAGVKVELADFAFAMPDEIAAGPQIWELTNVGEQWHEMVIVQLNEGVKPEDVLTFFETAGPTDVPPFELVAGYFPFSQGNRVWINIDLPAGDYTVVCFLPDLVGDMAPHLVHGMVRSLTVK